MLDVFDELHRRLDCLTVARDLGLKTRGRNFHCPDQSCKSSKEKCKAFRDGKWICYKCKLQGDAVDLIAVARGLSTSDALAEAKAMAGMVDDKPLPPLPPPPPESVILSDEDFERTKRVLSIATDHYDRIRRDGDEYLASLGPMLSEVDREKTNIGLSIARAYLNRRGIPPLAKLAVPVGVVPAWRTGLDLRLRTELGPDGVAMGEAAGLIRTRINGRCWETFRGRAWLPWRDADGQTVNAKGRAIDDLADLCGLHVDKDGRAEIPMWFLCTSGDEESPPHTRRPEHPFGWYAAAKMVLSGAHPPLFIVEGELDAVSALLIGRPAVATGGTSGVGRAGLRELIASIDAEVMVLFDGDEPGPKRDNTEARARDLAAGLKCPWGLLPSGDINDLLQPAKGGSRGVLGRALYDAVATANPPPNKSDGGEPPRPKKGDGGKPPARPPGGGGGAPSPPGRPRDLETEGHPRGWGVLSSTGELLRRRGINPEDGQEDWTPTGLYRPPHIAWRGRDVYDQQIVVGVAGEAAGVRGEVERAVSRDRIKSAREIIAALTPFGFDVQQATAGHLVLYLSDYEREFANELGLREGSSQMGWHGGAFLYGEDVYGGDGPLEYIGGNEQRVKALGTSGTMEGWIDGVLRPMERYPIAMLGLYAALSAPVLHHCPDMTGFAVEFSGISSRGKSTVSSSIASGFGDPRLDTGLLRPPMDTDVYLEEYAAFQCSLPLFLEDTHLMDHDRVRNNVMAWVNGSGKGRGKADGGMRRTRHWKSVAILTGEASVAGSTSYGGVGSRVLSFVPPLPEASENPRVIDDVRTMARARVRHYGHAGRAWVKYLVDGGVAEVLRVYDDWLPVMQRRAPTVGTAQRWASALAMVLATCQVAHPVIGGTDVTTDVLEVACEHLVKSAPPDQAEAALDLLLAWVATDAGGGIEGDTQGAQTYQRQVWYRIFQDGHVCVELFEAKRRLAQLGVHLPDMLREWEKRGWVSWKGEVKSRHRVKMARGNVYAIPISPDRTRGFLGEDESPEPAEDDGWLPQLH